MGGGRMRRIGLPRSRAGKAGGGLGVIVIALIAMFFGIDPGLILGLAGGGGQPQVVSQSRQAPANDEMAQFVSTILADTEDVWNPIFRERGGEYREPKLVLFSDRVSSACGMASSASGPFYCPGDQKVYIDLVFFDDLATRFGAPGDFAQAYVIAHEVGHHVQTLMGISQQVTERKRQVSEVEGNRYSVMLELQADCFAGVWAHRAEKSRNLIEEEKGDIEEGIGAATAIGDDRLQKQSRGYVTPDSFTHGSSEQRVRWFIQGLKTGNIDSCNTFGAGTL